jgi:hypothetical protein
MARSIPRPRRRKSSCNKRERDITASRSGEEGCAPRRRCEVLSASFRQWTVLTTLPRDDDGICPKRNTRRPSNNRNARCEWRGQGRARSSITQAAFVVGNDAAHRRARRKGAGAAQRKAAMRMRDRNACGERRDQARARASMTCYPTRESMPGSRYDAPLVDERAATRGRGATEGGEELAGAKRELPIRDPVLWQRPSPTARGDWMSVSRPHAPVTIAGNDAPLRARHPFELRPREPDRTPRTLTRGRSTDRSAGGRTG